MPDDSKTAVEERRLRVIYDHLDTGNNPGAVQEADRMLRKDRGNQCTKALKAIALVRMAHFERAWEVLRPLMDEHPTRDEVLQAVAISLREMNEHDKIIELYENAAPKALAAFSAAKGEDKTKERYVELLSHLFMAYVRRDKFQGQQTTATQLYKVSKLNTYFCWSVMSRLMLAEEAGSGGGGDGGTSPAAADLQLNLAEGMMAKLDRDGQVDSERIVHLYLLVLERKGKYREALAVMDGEHGRRLRERSHFVRFVDGKRIQYLRALQEWDGVNSLAKRMLKDTPDEWSLYLDYIDSLLHLVRGPDSSANHVGEADDEGGESADRTLSAGLAFVRGKSDGNPSARSPFLAQMELKHRVDAAAGEDIQSQEWDQVSMLGLTSAYFARFSHRPVCRDDLKPYVRLLTAEERETFKQEAEKSIQYRDGDSDVQQGARIPKDTNEVIRHSCLMALERYLGRHRGPAEHGLQVASTLMRYKRAGAEFEREMKKNEHRPSDLYLLLGAHCLWDVWTAAGEDEVFWRAAVQLHQARDDYRVAFLLVKFLNRAGAAGFAARQYYKLLDLKHVQLDSLSYVVQQQLYTQAHFAQAASLAGEALKFFVGNHKECVDNVVICYKEGNFPKIGEFLRFRDRVARSLSYVFLRTERVLSDLVAESAAHAQSARVVSYLDVDPAEPAVGGWLDALRDNRDLGAALSYEPEETALSQKQIEASFALSKVFLNLRHLTVRAIVAAVRSANSNNNSSSPQQQQQQNKSRGGHQQESRAPSPPPPPVAAERAVSPEVLERLCQELDAAAVAAEEAAAAHPAEAFQRPMQCPDRPRLHLYVRYGLHRLLPSLLRLVSRVHDLLNSSSPDSAAAAEAVQSVPGELTKMLEMLRSAPGVAAPEEKRRRLFGLDRTFEQFVIVLEAATFICVFLGVCRDLIARATSQKKGKKKNKDAQKPDVSSFVDAFNASLESADAAVLAVKGLAAAMLGEGVTGQEKGLADGDSTAVRFSRLSVEDGEGEQEQLERMDQSQIEMAKSIDESHRRSLEAILEVCASKQGYLKGIRL